MPNAAAFELTNAGPDAADGLAAPQRSWAIVTVVLAVFMSVLDSAIANVALPTIARDLNASAAGSIWVVNAYQLAITVLLLPLASLGEILGYRRVYLVGLVVFTIASLCCALAASLLTLTLARVLQGVGAAGIMSVNGALVRFIYPRHLLGRGIGMVAIVVAVAAALGPTVAAAILAVASWHWLFAVNLPPALLALAAARALPRNRGVKRRFDLPSALLNAVFFGLLIFAIDGAAHGQGAALIAGEAVGALAVGVALVLRQLPQTAPLLPVDLLRIPLFALSIATSVCSFAAQMLAYVALPFYLQDMLGRTHVETGLLMTPWPLTTGAMALLAGRLADRFSAGILGGIGLAVFASGLALLASLPAMPSSADIVWRMMVCGFGFGLFQTPNNRAIITAAPPERSGGASGMLPTARLLGQTTGAALAALVFALFAERATTVALVVAAAVAAVAAGVSFVRVIERA
ncbi:MAG TPA: MFS transporter [Stellaceae bacterium]|nr:MFS transporter [Stellaceae bacterium]